MYQRFVLEIKASTHGTLPPMETMNRKNFHLVFLSMISVLTLYRESAH